MATEGSAMLLGRAGCTKVVSHVEVNITDMKNFALQTCPFEGRRKVKGSRSLVLY